MENNENEIIDAEFVEVKDGTTQTNQSENVYSSSDVVIIDDIYKDKEVITDIIYEGKTDVTLRDVDYMCNFISSHQGCEYCPFCPSNPARSCAFAGMIRKGGGSVELLNSQILDWLSMNPPTSYLMDIRERMPNVMIDKDYNIPNFCVQNIYGKDCCKCCHNDTSKFSIENLGCRECWRKPMD